MKITNAQIIKNGEQELIDAITADLDWGAIEEIFLKEHNLGIEEDIVYKSGDIVAFKDQIAYKLEFEVKVNLSVLLDRNGDYLAININNSLGNQQSNENIPVNETHTEKSVNDKDVKTEESGTAPFIKLCENDADDMGQKVDDILENIKKAG